MKLDQKIQDKINYWLSDSFDEESRNNLKKMVDANQKEELIDAFYKDLEFGTGGLRGIMGVGTNRINKYTLGAATQGLSNYLKKQYPGETISVAIAHDNRNNATQFANIVADVFSANGIVVHFFQGLRPTPELSFAIRYLGCKSGVMLTASHNPREYSGYKAYWTDGGQVVPPHDKNIIKEVNAIEDITEIQFNRNPDLVKNISPKVDLAFLTAVTNASVNPQITNQYPHLSMVFSPIHGAAVDMVPAALKKMGFTNVHLVEEQCVTDGNFPTVIYPNPEEKEAMTLSIQKANEVNAELAMASDPDGDRVGIAIRNPMGKMVLLNGNQTGSLLFHYVMKGWKDKGKLTGIEYIVKTIVTTYLIDKIAQSMDIACYNTLTGFKHIGALMTQLENKKQFLVGGEESYGYLIGDHVRDKDAVVSCAIIAEMASWYKSRGKTLYDALIDLYLEYGFYSEKLIALTRKGKAGEEEIKTIMESLRHKGLQTIANEKVLISRDYLSGIERNLHNGTETPIDLPTSNVLQFVTDKGTVVSARPSGTEPKIKFYISVNSPLPSAEQYENIREKLDEKIRQIEGEFVRV